MLFWQVEEVYNFSQDDLLTEDILILDSHAEVFVWVGQSVNSKEKQDAFEIGKKYIEMAVSMEGLSPNVPLYKVTEGNEPSFFTAFFSWDPTKAMVQGNSFQKKAALLFGVGHAVEDKSSGNQGGPTQRASALAALNSAFNSTSGKPGQPSQDRSNGSTQGPTQRAAALAALSSAFSSSPGTKTPPPKPSGTGGSQRAAAVAALSSVLTAEKPKKSPDVSPTRSSRSPPSEEVKSENAYSEADGSEEVAEAKETEEAAPASESTEGDSQPKPEIDQGDSASESIQSTFSYDQLKVHSENPVTGIDFKRREAYLSEDEFQTIFGMTKEDFYKLPKWKQDMQKKKSDLF
ncbi:hypothetical protein HS088_TW05G00707 [Tripterygium wilfordii]|uniref:HP domain-containing protein n=1 Tax=Tripterygium wilfordii TaxID=458696 RepID=A0A7J7DPF9_TRIWF|nr:hypothetical protein HS088_TW05G00707 [Tripterygium wilfordii]